MVSLHCAEYVDNPRLTPSSTLFPCRHSNRYERTVPTQLVSPVSPSLHSLHHSQPRKRTLWHDLLHRTHLLLPNPKLSPLGPRLHEPLELLSNRSCQIRHRMRSILLPHLWMEMFASPLWWMSRTFSSGILDVRSRLWLCLQITRMTGHISQGVWQEISS